MHFLLSAYVFRRVIISFLEKNQDQSPYLKFSLIQKKPFSKNGFFIMMKVTSFSLQSLQDVDNPWE